MLAGLAQLADNFVSDPARSFTLGQSVRASVVTVDTERGRFSLALKHSLTNSGDGLDAESLFASLEAAERIRRVLMHCSLCAHAVHGRASACCSTLSSTAH